MASNPQPIEEAFLQLWRQSRDERRPVELTIRGITIVMDHSKGDTPAKKHQEYLGRLAAMTPEQRAATRRSDILNAIPAGLAQLDFNDLQKVTDWLHTRLPHLLHNDGALHRRQVLTEFCRGLRLNSEKLTKATSDPKNTTEWLQQYVTSMLIQLRNNIK